MFTAPVTLCIMLLLNNSEMYSFPKKMIVNTPITDLREQPKKACNTITLPAGPDANPLQTSQLLLGEYIVAEKEIINEHGEHWLQVSALQQKIYYEEHGWQGYPGWIEANHAIEVNTYPRYNLVVKGLLAPILNDDNQEVYQVSVGTRLQGTKDVKSEYWHITLPDNTDGYIHNDHINELYSNWDMTEQDLRYHIVNQAKQFLDSDYSWGGRSAQNKNITISSVDCSALVHLSYLTQGLQIPRMSHEQFLAGIEVEQGTELQPGDLIMFSTIPSLKRIDLAHIDHVMMYIGDDMLLESTMSGDKNVRIVSCKERFNKSIYEITSGDIAGHQDFSFYIYFASYLHNPELIMQLRENAVRYNSKIRHLEQE